MQHSREQEFTEFVAFARPRLARALFGAVGTNGPDATAEALAFAWEHWDRVRKMENPIGYLYRVGQSRSRSRKVAYFPAPPDIGMPDIEPGLPRALESLSERQRVCAVLVLGFEWTHDEVAGLLGISASSVRVHLERGLRRLREQLEVHADDFA